MRSENDTNGTEKDANELIEKSDGPKVDAEETPSIEIGLNTTDPKASKEVPDTEASPEEMHIKEGELAPAEELTTIDKDGIQVSGSTSKKPGRKLLAVIMGGSAVLVIAIIVLSMSVFSPQAKADKLYEQGAYAEALKAYEEIGDENKNGSKMSDCRYWAFIDYLLANGPYETSAEDGTDVTWTVEGYSNGDITCTVSGGMNGNSIGADTQFAMTIHHSETNADFSASSKILILYISSIETGSGTIDLPSYSYGKTINFDRYENSGNSSNNSYIKKNSGVVTKMIQKGLLAALNASGTGAGLSDLGFTNLD